MNLETDGLRADPALPNASAGVLAGVVVRPRYLAWDGARYRGARVRLVSAESLAGLPGIVQVLVERDFVGIVAQTDAFAQAAAACLQVDWESDAHAALAGKAGDTNGGSGPGEAGHEHTYRWPPALPRHDGAHATAWFREGTLTVWAAWPEPEALREELAALLRLPTASIDVRDTGTQAGPGSYDVAADAALLSRAVGRPVRVEAGPGFGGSAGDLAIVVQAHGASDGRIEHLELACAAAGGARPSIARLLAHGFAQPSRRSREVAVSYAFLDETPSRSGKAMRLPAEGLDPGQALAADIFAIESYLDERAHAGGVDAVELRLRHMADERGAALLLRVSEEAGGAPAAASGGTRRGRGVAYASWVSHEATAPSRTWSAWVMDVAVDSAGRVEIERVVVGHDSEHLVPIAPESAQLEVQRAAALLLHAPAFDDWGTPDASQLREAAVPGPAVQVVTAVHPLAPAGALGWNGVASVPAAPALANAIFGATGVRLRQPPFSGAQVELRLAQPGRQRKLRRLPAILGGVGALAAGLIATLVPWRAEILPAPRPAPGLYSSATIERGRLVAAAGDCIVCHTAPGGTANAGGLALETPFGTIYSTNITPDAATGIGNWSFAAFERAMRQGIHRDGRRLYPAFPYTAFAKVSDGDLQALYAYLMSQEPVQHKPPETRLAFPFNIRGTLGAWNLLFHDDKPYQPDPQQSAEWNRGAYLVQGLGHCGACHTPRNALGAEKSGPASFLAGGLAEGWEAPALTALSKAPVPWTAEDLYAYLRTGMSARHGVAAGPMAPVVQELAQLPESDVRAMATYLVSLNPRPENEAPWEPRVRELQARSARDPLIDSAGARIYEGACAACHASSGPTLFGSKVSLGLNTNLHSDRPDNLVQVILHGIQEPAHPDLGYMPGFADTMDDRQIEELVHYLRRRFADGKPEWKDVGATIARARRGHSKGAGP
jgi:nicotinate dehydrogenase subunit B